MSKYRLKAGVPSFQPVSGKFAGVTFEHDVDYEAMPDGYGTRFIQVGKKRVKKGKKEGKRA